MNVSLLQQQLEIRRDIEYPNMKDEDTSANESRIPLRL